MEKLFFIANTKTPLTAWNFCAFIFSSEIYNHKDYYVAICGAAWK
jgi:hypothetical protein